MSNITMISPKALRVFICVTALLLPSWIRAQESYPSKPLSLVVTFGAGAMDTIARSIAKAAEKDFGQPIMVENKPGGGGAIGMINVLKSKPDGYTIGVTGTSNFIVTPHVQTLPFNVLTDMKDILAIAKYNFLLTVKADSPWKNFDEFLDYVKKNPGKFSYSTVGVGTAAYISMERIALHGKLKWNPVPFKGGGEAIAAVLGGHTQGVIMSAVESSPHIKAGKLRPLLILSDSRLPEFPNVPSVMDKGYDVPAIAYISLFGPKALPESIRQKLEDVFKKALSNPSYIEVTQQFQIEIPKFKGGKEYNEYWKSRYEDMGNVIKTLGIKAN